MSRGRVVDAGTVDSSSFSLNTDQSWTPLACVMVYYTLPDGEIVNDALQVTFTQVLRNTVRVQDNRNITASALHIIVWKKKISRNVRVDINKCDPFYSSIN